MTADASEVQRMLPAIPYVVLRDSVPGRLALRLIVKAIEYGWRDDQAAADVARGRQAMQGDRWQSTPDLDADLLRHRAPALQWLAAKATPLGFELHPYDDAVVLIGRSDIL